MRDFRDIAAFLRFMEGMAGRVQSGAQIGLKQAADLIAREAKDEIGQYQPASGEFPEWATLSEATLYGFLHPLAGWIEGKIDAGYATETEHRPLERTDAMRDSIETAVEPGRSVVGSHDMILVYQEMGTPDARFPIPPRPVLGPAAFRNEAKAVHLMAGHVVLTLAGVPVSGPRALLLQEIGR